MGILRRLSLLPRRAIAAVLILISMLAVGCSGPAPTSAPVVNVPTANPGVAPAEPTQVPIAVATPVPTSIPEQGASSASEVPEVGAVAPDFTLVDLDGTEMTLSDYRGSAVLVMFWAVRCPACRAEMPELVKVYEALKDDGLVVLAVNLQETKEKVVDFINDPVNGGVSFPVLLDQQAKVGRQYLLQFIPTNVFIDRDGVVRDIVIGGMGEPALLERSTPLL